MLLAVPVGAFPSEVLELGQVAAAEELFGPSMAYELPGTYFDPEFPLVEPSQEAPAVDLVMIDVRLEFVPLLHELEEYDLHQVRTFSIDPTVVPSPSLLVDAALNWVQGGEAHSRIAYYSAEEEVPETPTVEATPKAASHKPKERGAGTTGDVPKAKKKPTVASLSESMEQVSQTLPMIMQQLEALQARQNAMEAATSPGRPSALRQPLGGFHTSGSPLKPLGSLVKEMPPPKGTATPTSKAAPRVKILPEEVHQLEEDLETTSSNDLAKAVLAQSKALTALVGQIAGTTMDPMHDLASSSTGVSSRGAAGRAKLQQELSQHKGVFHQAVMQSMARRMQPSQPADVSMEAMRDRGITATRYLERFGGFGRVKEYGHMAWQLALVMDHIQEQNWNAVKDSVALMLVSLEQMALDQGRQELGLLLALAEEPPQSVFSNRSLAQGGRPVAFAPLADQRWVTTALQYVKELDAITSRRTDTKPTPKEPAPTTPNPKKKGQKGGKGKQREKAEEEQE